MEAIWRRVALGRAVRSDPGRLRSPALLPDGLVALISLPGGCRSGNDEGLPPESGRVGAPCSNMLGARPWQSRTDSKRACATARGTPTRPGSGYPGGTRSAPGSPDPGTTSAAAFFHALLAAVCEELENDPVEVLGRLGHHDVGTVGAGHEVGVGDLVGELAVELGRRELVVTAADDDRAL